MIMTLWLVGCLAVVTLIGIGVLFGGAPFVPTRRKWLDQAMELAKIGPNDVLVDLGSGNGSALIAAVESGAKRAIGYEISPLLTWWSKLKTIKLKKQIEIHNANFWFTELPKETTVIYLFQTNPTLKRIEKYLDKQRDIVNAKKLRVVCFGFDFPNIKPIDCINGMTLYEI